MVKKGIRLTKELLDAALAGGTILGGPTNFPSVGIPGPQVS